MSQDSNQAVYRILDASTNRVGEGLRTIEEWSRFGLDNAEITRELKTIRHMITEAMSVVPRNHLVAARDTPGDVGTKIQTTSELSRNRPRDVVAAGIARTGQSLRVLEEYLKTIDAATAQLVEQARYRFYTVTAKLELLLDASDRVARLDSALLYVLVDAGPSADVFADNIAKLAEAGVDVFQLRDRSQTDRTLIERARMATEIAQQHGALVIMNDRADLAIAAGCDGVHVGQDELPLADARRIVGGDRLVGVSTHKIEEAIEAQAGGADYIGCGPMFPSRTKSFDQFVGLAYAKDVSKKISIPAFAIGGIDGSNLQELMEAGVDRVAVTGAVRDAGDPVAEVRRLKATLTTPAKVL